MVLDLWTLRLAKVAARLDEPEKQVPDVSTGHDTDESTDDRSDSETGQERSQGKKVKAKTNPLLRETVALCYLAMVVLRQPTPLKDLFRYEHHARPEGYPSLTARTAGSKAAN